MSKAESEGFKEAHPQPNPRGFSIWLPARGFTTNPPAATSPPLFFGFFDRKKDQQGDLEAADTLPAAYRSAQAVSSNWCKHKNRRQHPNPARCRPQIRELDEAASVTQGQDFNLDPSAASAAQNLPPPWPDHDWHHGAALGLGFRKALETSVRCHSNLHHQKTRTATAGGKPERRIFS